MTLGNEIDTRGIQIDAEDGEFVSDIVVVAEIIDKNGKSRVSIASGELTNWVKENGMLDIAHKMTSNVSTRSPSWE